MASETTAAIIGKVGVVRRDPFAMLPFCGYHFGDYFKHWLALGKGLAHAPKIYGVNWFRRDANGKFLWPGFGENMRVLKWIVERCEGKAGAAETAIGRMPRFEDMEFSGLEQFDQAMFGQLTQVDAAQWKDELKDHDELFTKLASRLPAELKAKRDELAKAL